MLAATGQTTRLQRFKQALIVCLLLPLSVPTALAGSEIIDFRLSEDRQRTRLVFALDSPVEHSLFSLSKPERVVIDIKNVRLNTSLPRDYSRIAALKNIRHAPRDGKNLRVVLDLDSAARTKSFLLRPNQQAGYRLVIDLFNDRTKKQVTKRLPKQGSLRNVVIAIDAGHGGKDPGAIGRNGIYEKNVALAIARELAAKVNKQPGMQAILTRDGDYYMGLRDRMDKARKNKADLFVSIHADAYKNRQARGSSVYALSLRGASSEAAQWLADKENAADLIGGVSLDDKDDLVASVLLDLSQNATIQASMDVGKTILAELGNYTTLHKSHVQQAGFIVLKSPDIPSVLIETAFISNPQEERRLISKRHQRRFATAILAGITRYFKRKAPPGTLLASKRNSDQISAAY